MHDELSGVALQIYGRYKHVLLNYTTPLDSVTSGLEWGSNARVCHSGLRRAEPRQRTVQTVKYAICPVSLFHTQNTSNKDYCLILYQHALGDNTPSSGSLQFVSAKIMNY